jgi:hypothetical protein
LKFSGLGQAGRMHKIIRRSVILGAAAAPVAALSVVMSAAGSAEPLNCPNGEYWEPVSNTCQKALVPLNCAPGEYWNPVSNLCRPLGQV